MKVKVKATHVVEEGRFFCAACAQFCNRVTEPCYCCADDKRYKRVLTDDAGLQEYSLSQLPEQP